jgi:hypothetical protein
MTTLAALARVPGTVQETLPGRTPSQPQSLIPGRVHTLSGPILELVRLAEELASEWRAKIRLKYWRRRADQSARNAVTPEDPGPQSAAAPLNAGSQPLNRRG